MALQIRIIPVTAFQQNCTLLWDDDTMEGVLIDLGGEVNKVKHIVDQLQVKVKELWLTHGHLDHVAGINDWNKISALPVIGPHIEDEFWLEQLPTITTTYGFPYSDSFKPTRWLVEGDQLTVGKYQFVVLYIPGHTPGSVVFYCASEKLLIAGDVLFRDSIGRTDFPRGNHQDLIVNIKQKLLILADDVTVIPGHGPSTTIGYEKRNNPFLS